MYVVNQIYDTDVHSYTEILLAISNCCQEGQVYTLCVEDKLICLIICQVHIITTILSEVKYDCTSTVLYESLQKRYCKSRVRHYCENISIL